MLISIRAKAGLTQVCWAIVFGNGGGRSVNLAGSSFDWGVMRTKSSRFRPNHFLLKGKVKIGRTFLSVYPVWYVMRKDSCDPPKLGEYAEIFSLKRS